MTIKYKVLMSETYSVWYSVDAKSEQEAEDKVRNGDYDRELENSPEESYVLTVRETA